MTIIDGKGETSRWLSNNVLKGIGAVLLVIATAAVTHEFDLTRVQQKQDDAIADHERRLEKLEAMLETSLSDRRDLGTRLRVIEEQHKEMMVQLGNIQDALLRHERESRRNR